MAIVDEAADPAAGALGSYRNPGMLRWPAAFQAAVWSATPVLDRSPWRAALAALFLLYTTLVWLPATVVTRQGIRRPLQRRLRPDVIAWPDVAGLPEPGRWDMGVTLQLRDGRVLTLTGVPPAKVADLEGIWLAATPPPADRRDPPPSAEHRLRTSAEETVPRSAVSIDG